MSLLEVIASGGNLEKLINTASKLMGNPLIVVDLSYKVLANSPEENITDFFYGLIMLKMVIVRMI